MLERLEDCKWSFTRSILGFLFNGTLRTLQERLSFKDIEHLLTRINAIFNWWLSALWRPNFMAINESI
jgi:hypothetical protein